ncbi:mannosyl-3-phosphoglycerate phosphatase-related protein [secondary endosymbiont of Ctenarytaina eucalypti]|uniref:HAD-superfamily hydrolase, subfamily IIB/mannosyl-3-phosphoglycerate phosphatase family n=1 Tax=secondary endosymbiont of Ctenarytaina eucalypti TaxID=1199245 RepID=J3VRD5_9ENTR|nr:mannosyl-3-phosphoglycerate phosphatase-related protein [secondary endosymbiont of Ctenarytaina eucalypti]AFP84511.1 HAD-superfamily hydrolase, subfamily IIB/mannosyl-3-phosphoglycerate phosphatase family [secondary endosymbiont of Ctenarytaina eucalypti]
MPRFTDPLLVITDLDGSLLDHYTYQWQTAAPWLAKLKENDIPVVLCSSKTTAEIVTLQTQLGLVGAPFIAENGAALKLDSRWKNAQLSTTRYTGKDYISLRTIMTHLRKVNGYKFFGFGDMTNYEVAKWTGLSVEEAQLAKNREASEAFIWQDTRSRLTEFISALKKEDLALTEGGRCYHVMSRGYDKGVAVRWILKQYRQKGDRNWKTLGLGDGPNDQPMLAAVNYAVIIRGYGKMPLMLSKSPSSVYYTQDYGPKGWVEGLNYFITET